MQCICMSIVHKYKLDATRCDVLARKSLVLIHSLYRAPRKPGAMYAMRIYPVVFVGAPEPAQRNGAACVCGSKCVGACVQGETVFNLAAKLFSGCSREHAFCVHLENAKKEVVCHICRLSKLCSTCRPFFL